MDLVIHILSCVHCAILIDRSSLSIAFIFLEGSFEYISRAVIQNSLATFLVISPLSFVTIIIFIGHHTLPMAMVVLPLPFITNVRSFGRTNTLVDSMAMTFIMQPVAFVAKFVFPGEGSFAIKFVL
jgi:hypothetical protein